MRIWFDADNGPHALIMHPILAELESRGHSVVCTARNRTRTPELLELYGIPHRIVGGEYPAGMSGKVRGTLGRAWALYREMRNEPVDVSFGHGSRALPIASRLMNVPSVTMYDYEWVNARLFNLLCRSILLPSVITPARCADAGIDVAKVVGYPGFKEELYLGAGTIDTTVAADLGLRADPVRVLLRPPATTAHYHNPEAEVIFARILGQLAMSGDLQLVLLPRSPDQVEQVRAAGIGEVIIPERVYDGPSLVAAMDVVISGGGTMTREAAIMGVPAYSFFRGRSGMVDEALADSGRLILLPTPDAVATNLAVRKRQGTIRMPDPTPMIRFIADSIIAAAD